MLEHPFISFFPTLFKRFINRPIIIRSHNIEFERFKTIGKWYWPIIKSLEKFVHARADFNFFITAEDLAIAVNEFSLDKKNCFVLPYGVELSKLPDDKLIENCKLQVRQMHGLTDEKILLFNGSLSYAPNQTAVEHIVEELLPALEKTTIDFKIIICGKGLKQELVEKIKKSDRIIFAGFVDEIYS